MKASISLQAEPKEPGIMEQSRQALAACAALRIMFERDFALAEQLGVSLVHGPRSGQRQVLDMKHISFQHPDSYT
jgi:hypothetical protein